jgi:hypothetical protein
MGSAECAEHPEARIRSAPVAQRCRSAKVPQGYRARRLLARPRRSEVCNVRESSGPNQRMLLHRGRTRLRSTAKARTAGFGRPRRVYEPAPSLTGGPRARH